MKIDYDIFEKIMLSLQSINDKPNLMCKNGIDITQITDDLTGINDMLLHIIFGEDANEWIEWWCYEKDFGRRQDITAFDENNKEIILNDIRSLYEFINNEYLKN